MHETVPGFALLSALGRKSFTHNWGIIVISIFGFVLILLVDWAGSKLVIILARQQSWAVLLLFHCCRRSEAHEAKLIRSATSCVCCLSTDMLTHQKLSVCALSLHGLYERDIWFDLTGNCMNRQVKHIHPPGTSLCFALNSFKSPFIQIVWSKPLPFVCCLESLTYF